MADTIILDVPANTWVDVATLSGSLDGVINNSGSSVLKVFESEIKPDDAVSEGAKINPNQSYTYAALSTTAVWIRSATVSGQMSVFPHAGNVSTINQLLSRRLIPDVSTSPSVPIAQGDTSITLVSSAGFVEGGALRIQEAGIFETYTYTITSPVVGNAITVDAPVGRPYSTAAEVIAVEENIASLAGTIANPVIYSLAVPEGEDWVLTSFVFELSHDTAGDNSTFGDISGGLTNGILFRGVDDIGQVANFVNWKTNGDISLSSETFEYTDKAGPGVFGTRGFGTMVSNIADVGNIGGISVRNVQLVVQDDLTTLPLAKLLFKGVARLG